MPLLTQYGTRHGLCSAHVCPPLTTPQLWVAATAPDNPSAHHPATTLQPTLPARLTPRLDLVTRRTSRLDLVTRLTPRLDLVTTGALLKVSEEHTPDGHAFTRVCVRPSFTGAVIEGDDPSHDEMHKERSERWEE